jgi:hypothetical protein
MSTQSTKPSDMQFAEFTGQLISETFMAVVQSMLQQEKEIREMESMALMELEDLARIAVTDDMVRAEVLRLFPSRTGQENQSAVDPEVPYLSAQQDRKEDPPVFLLTGYQITKGDIEKDPVGRGYRITDLGYGHIAWAVRLLIALIYRQGLLSTVQRGIPRIYVDHGRVNTKLTFTLTDRKQGNPSQKPSLFKGAVRLPGLAVRPVSNKTPEFLGLRVDVIGEVEITFKTISG